MIFLYMLRSGNGIAVTYALVISGNGLDHVEVAEIFVSVNAFRR